MAKMRGRVWKFGDHIDTDQIIPARYLNTSDPEELAKHVMEDADPEFPKKVRKGDFIVAGENFGCGSSREHAPVSIKYAGISGIIAKSFARIFFRNAINIALPVVEAPEFVDKTETGDVIALDLEAGKLVNETKGFEVKVQPYTGLVKEIMKSGGLVEYARKLIAG